MEVRGAAASDFEVEVQGDDRRGIGVARRSFISDTPVSDNAGGSSPTGTTNSGPEKLRSSNPGTPAIRSCPARDTAGRLG